MSRRNKHLIGIILLLGFAFSLCDTLMAKKKEIVVCLLDMRRSESKWIDKIRSIEERAFKQLGYSVRWQILPAKRELAYFLKGICDANGIRSKYISKEVSDLLVRVDEPITIGELKVLGRRSNEAINRSIKTLKDIDKIKYRIGYLRGIAFLEDKLESFKSASIISLSKIDNGIMMLEFDRLDFFIGPFRAERVNDLNNASKIDTKIKLEGMQFSLYLWLHKKYGFLKEDLEKAIQKLKD